MTHTCNRLIGEHDDSKQVLCPWVCAIYEKIGDWLRPECLRSNAFRGGTQLKTLLHDCMLYQIPYDPGNVPACRLCRSVHFWERSFMIRSIRNTQEAQQLRRTCCKMHDSAFHAYKSSPMFCQLISTCIDPFTSLTLLASEKLSSDSQSRRLPIKLMTGSMHGGNVLRSGPQKTYQLV